jgi:mRNA-degrading endonuclease YafQ of YafQ-DinJ toxin-antitoxin module
MKKVVFSSKFQRKLIFLQKKDTVLFKKVKKQLELFRLDREHPSLRLHKLKGNLKNVWSLSVTMDVRILFTEDTEYYFFDIGTHAQVYK